MKQNRRGASTVELLLVFTLVVLFGVTMVTLILSGGTVYQRIVERKNAEGDARTAISYVNVLIHQSDEEGAIRVAPVDCSDREALALRFQGDDAAYTRWVYFREGALWECITDEGAQPEPELSQKIIEIDDYRVAMEGNRVEQTVGYTSGGKLHTLSMTAMLRSQ